MDGLGLLAYVTPTGLGNQTALYARYLKPETILVVDLSHYKKLPPVHSYQAKNIRIVQGIPTAQDMRWLVDNSQTLLAAETPLDYYLFDYARKRGVKTTLVYNFEFLDYLSRPNLPKPDVLARPSSWRHNEVPFQTVPLPVMADHLIAPRSIKTAKTFVHIVGKPAIYDRNGTSLVVEALQDIREPLNFIFYCQDEQYAGDIKRRLMSAPHHNIEYRPAPVNHHDLYKDGDVLVLPRRYGGLCLPMQEAHAAGMPVIMLDIEPNRGHIHPDLLIPATTTFSFKARTDIDVYKSDSLAAKLQPLNGADISLYSSQALDWREHHLYSNLEERYKKCLQP